jgi:hypothetical protein
MMQASIVISPGRKRNMFAKNLVFAAILLAAFFERELQ